MSTSTPEPIRRLRVPGYCIAGLLAVAPIIDLATKAWPMRIHEVPWRLAAADGVASSMISFLLALFLISALAIVMRDTVPILIVSALSFAAALLCVVVALGFALDALQVRSQFAVSDVQRYTIASAWSFLKIVVSAITSFILGVAALRAARARSARATPATAKPVLIARGGKQPNTMPDPALPGSDAAGA